MLNITDRATTRQVIDAINTTGIKAPQAITDAYAVTTRVSEAAHNLGEPEALLAVAVTAALEDGRDPAADAEVQRIITLRGIAHEGLAQQVDAQAFGRFREVCHEHADQLVKEWAKAFNEAAATLTAAHKRIGNAPLDDTGTIMRRGGDIAAVWAQAKDAAKTIDAILGGWYALGELTRLARNDKRYHALRLAAVDYDTWRAKGLDRQRPSAWEALLAGLTLSLPTFGEYRDRVATIERGAQAVETVVDTQRSLVAGREIRVPA